MKALRQRLTRLERRRGDSQQEAETHVFVIPDNGRDREGTPPGRHGNVWIVSPEELERLNAELESTN